MALAWIFVLLLIAFCVSFTPRSSALQGNELKVRTWWLTVSFDLRKAVGVQPVSEDELGRFRTLRLFGVGWPLKRFGWFHNSQLGTYLNMVDDPAHMWMVQFPHRKLLVSPAEGMREFASTLPLR